MNKETDQTDDLSAEQEPAASSRLPLQRPRRRRRRHGDHRNAGRLGDHYGGSERDGLALDRHRRGVHRRLDQTVICEIPDPLPVAARELDLFTVILRDEFDRLLSDVDDT